MTDKKPLKQDAVSVLHSGRQDNQRSETDSLNLDDVKSRCLTTVNISELLPQGIRIIDIHNNVIYINQAFSVLAGCSPEQLVGKKCYQNFPGSYCHSPTCILERMKNGEKAVQAEINWNDDSNRRTYVLSALPLNTEDGTLFGIIEYFLDVTDTRKLEQKAAQNEVLYSELFNNVPVPIIEYDFSLVKKHYDKLRSQGVTNFRKHFYKTAPQELLKCESLLRPVRLNKHAAHFFGLDSPEEHKHDMEKRHNRNLHKNEGPKECHIGLAEGKTQFDYEAYVEIKDGDYRYLFTSVSVAPGCEESLAIVYLSFVDITDRKKSEELMKKHQSELKRKVAERTAQLKESREKIKELYIIECSTRKELERLMKQRVEFNRMLVHELKTPLVPILGTISILSREIEAEPTRSMLENIQGGAIALSHRIDELLDLEKADSGSLHLDLELVDIAELLRRLHDYVKPQLSEKEQTISLTVTHDLPFIMGDKERLSQVILNLINNSYKYSPYGSHILVKAARQGSDIIVEIQDDGPGIPEEKRAELFKPNYAVSSNTDLRNGLGIGLALCNKLIGLHKGRIWLDSSTNQGSIFCISIPTYREAARNEIIDS